MYDPHYKRSDNLTPKQQDQIAEHERKRNMRTVFVEVKVKVVLDMEEGIEVTEVLEDMDYNFVSHTDGAEVADTEIKDWDVIDSK
jgi:hypothetical protein